MDLAVQNKIKSNRIRSAKMTKQRWMNIKLANATKTYLEQQRDDQCPHTDAFMSTGNQMLEKLEKSLRFSCNGRNTLYRKTLDNQYSLVHGMNSGHKLDFVSNSQRCKLLRSKYYNFLKENHEKGVFSKSGKIIEKNLLKECDFFHLMLSVPHTKKGYRGEKFYAKELIQRFNFLRKDEYFREKVIAGEYTTEIVENGENGYHIHLHILLITKNWKGNRDEIYNWILPRWNSLTVNNDVEQDEFTPETKEFLKDKGFAPEQIEFLNPKGSTIAWLESLYVTKKFVTQKEKKEGWKFSKRLSRQGKPVFIKYLNKNAPLEDKMKGIMECLKYHFEPFALHDDEGNFDIELIAKILPNIYRQRLYGKFGLFFGVKELNLKETPEEEIEQVLEEATEATHPITGEPLEREEYNYVLIDPIYIKHDEKTGAIIPPPESRVKPFPDEPFTLKQVLYTMVEECLRNMNKKLEKTRETYHSPQLTKYRQVRQAS